ncbi:MAG: hypothetical protein RIM99_10350 [Cyclobacteriaceae bacterium]
MNILFLAGTLISAAQDFDGPRPTGSSSNGINIANFYNTNIQLTAHTHSASHGILFNSYKPSTTISGSLGALGNTKHSQGAGAYSGGAGAIMYYGNGGTMQFLISETSPGANTDVVWGVPKMTIKKNGYVGIGTSSPTHLADIEGGAILGSTVSSPTYNDHVVILSDAGTAWEGGLIFQNAEGINRSAIKISSAFSSSSADLRIGRIDTSSPNTYLNDLIFLDGGGGNVGIGTTTPTEKMEVNGTIRSKEIKVEAAPWPDYVFADNYNLPSLEEIEKFIKSEGHLPEIPTADEVNENGIALGEMNALLLKKIEELTLHAIRQEKLIEEQQTEIENQNQRYLELANRIKQLESLENKN